MKRGLTFILLILLFPKFLLPAEMQAEVEVYPDHEREVVERKAIERLLTALGEKGIIKFGTTYSFNTSTRKVINYFCQENERNHTNNEVDKCVQEFIKNYATYLYQTKEYTLNLKLTILLLAIRSGNLEWCKKITEYGKSAEHRIDLEARCLDKNKKPVTPLILAIRLMHEDIIYYLLAQEAEITPSVTGELTRLQDRFKNDQAKEKLAKSIALEIERVRKTRELCRSPQDPMVRIETEISQQQAQPLVGEKKGCCLPFRRR